MQLSRRSLVAAGAILATFGAGFGAKRVAADEQLWITCNVGRPKTEELAWCQCFLAATRIATQVGEVAIEDLQIGDLVTTEGGGARAIRWIGRITVDRNGDAPWRTDAMPVRVSKDAFGKGSPHRDLYLSRAHMMYLNGVLIPVGDLINGKTVALVDVPGDQLVYYHVELETHDVLIAEGAPCESFLTTDRKLLAFDNADEYYALYGTVTDMVACAPLAAFVGGRSELKSRLRSAVAVIVDVREPRDVARDHLELRAIEMSKAA